MTYLPGSDEAIYPGTNHITADAVIEDDRHNVVLDLSPIAYPLDGLIPNLLRAIVDCGLWDAARVIASNRSAHPVVCDAIEALQSEPSIARCLQVTLTPADADRIATDLDDAALEPDMCAWDGCSNYRIDGDKCLAHVDADDDNDVAWGATA